MEDNQFALLEQREIIDLLIGGEIFPYITVNEINDIGIKFGTKPLEDTRWKMMKSIISNLHKKCRTKEFLHYYFYQMNITSAVRDIIKNNKEGRPEYLAISQICEESEKNNKIIADFLRKELINKINLELAVINKKIYITDNDVIIVESNNSPSITVDSSDIIGISYIKEILKNAKSDLLTGDFDSVITKSRTIIETVFINILKENNSEFKENGDIGKYQNLVNKALNMQPNSNWNKDVSSLISGLNRIVSSIASMRNNNSDSHGSSIRVRINSAEAELILNSAVNIALYYQRISDRNNKKA